MATRIYTEATDFDAQQGHFTIEGVDNQYYLRIGALNSEDRRLIASLIEDGFVGFFQDEVRIAIAGIASTYDATNDRIEIDRNCLNSRLKMNTSSDLRRRDRVKMVKAVLARPARMVNTPRSK